MSWRFQKLPITTTTVPDVDDMNENFYEIAEEIGGKLNEHNWKSGAFSSAVTNLALDSCFVYHSGANDLSNQRAQLKVSGSVVVPERSAWRRIDSTTQTFVAPGCLLWIHATAQINLTAYDNNPTAGSVAAVTANYNTAFFGIEVNGYVIPESVVGGSEPENDATAGVYRSTMPLGTSIIFPLPPGETTVSMVVRSGAKKDGKGLYVNNAELICLEMRR